MTRILVPCDDDEADEYYGYPDGFPTRWVTVDYDFVEDLYHAAMAHIEEYGTRTEYDEWPQRWADLVSALGIEKTPCSVPDGVD